MSVKVKKSVESLPAYKPAKSIISVSREYGIEEKDLIKLAGNENRLGCSKKVIEAINDNRLFFSYYPDMNVTRLREKLSEKLSVNGENLIFGNGSFELLTLVGETYIERGDEAIYTDPSFGWYQNVTLKNEGRIVKIPVTEKKSVDTEGILKAINERTKVIWLCNPNNPTGTVLEPEVLEDFISRVPENVLIVLDEAYIDFIDGDYIDTTKFIREYKNVIILRTFSKLYGLASFRVGYGIADESIINNILKVKLPINLSFTSQVAALAALEDEEFTEFVIKTNREQLEYYYREFEKLNLEYIPSNGNFILVNIGIDSAYAETEFLKRGILIRNGSEFGLNRWLRISVGKSDENVKVVETLKNILEVGEYDNKDTETVYKREGHDKAGRTVYKGVFA